MRHILFVLSFFVFLSCESDKDKAIPADVIPRDKFIEVLTDVRLLEGAYTGRYQKIDSSAYKINSHYLALYNKHGVSPDAFVHSYAYYAGDQSSMLMMEEVILDKLTKMQSGADTTAVGNNKLAVDSVNGRE